MARRRESVEAAGDVMPLALLDPGERVRQRAWFWSRQLYDWRDQHEAIQEARLAYGLEPDGRQPGGPDPRDLLQGLTNDA